MKWTILLISSVFFIVAFLIGHLVNCLCRQKESTVILNIFTGTLTVWALLELLLVPITFLNISFQVLSFLYGFLLIAGCIASLFFRKRMLEIFSDSVKNWKSYISWTTMIAIIIIIFQLYYIHHYTYFEWDDAFYVPIASDAIQTNQIFKINPEKGVGTGMLPRYALSLWAIFYALLGNWFHIPVAIIAHTVLPFITISFAYLVYTLMGRCLFPKDTEAQGYFLIFAAVMHMFLPNIHTLGSSYLLLAPWMGKAILSSISLPAILYLMLRLIKHDGFFGDWILLFINALAACLHTPMSIMFIPVLAGSLSFLWVLKTKKPAFFFKTVLSCTPCLLLGIFYLWMC